MLAAPPKPESLNDEGEGVLPDDPTGNRRYVAVVVKTPGSTNEEQSAHVRGYLDANRVQLWAEAMARYGKGEKSFISGGFEKKRDAMNTEYTRANQPLEQIAADLTSKHSDGTPVSLVDLMIEAKLARDAAEAQEKMRSSGRKLAGYLTRLSWAKDRATVDGVQKTLWFPPHRVGPAALDDLQQEHAIDDNGFFSISLGPLPSSTAMHSHGCDGATGWIHRAEPALPPSICLACRRHLANHNAPPPGQGELEGMARYSVPH